MAKCKNSFKRWAGSKDTLQWTLSAWPKPPNGLSRVS